jgi:formate dehydrogenase accessory protein FdhD
MQDISLLNIADTTTKNLHDKVIVETPFIITIASVTTLSILCTPTNINEMVAGTLFTQNIIADKNDIITINVRENTIFVEVKNPEQSLKNHKIFVNNQTEILQKISKVDITNNIENFAVKNI